MSPNLVVVAGVGLENPTQVPLARNHQMVKAFVPDRANKPLHVSVLPTRARRDRVIADGVPVLKMLAVMCALRYNEMPECPM